MKTLYSALFAILATSMAHAETPGEVLNRQGNDLAREGKLREAVAIYDRAVAIEPDYAEPFYNRGKAKLNLKDFQGAIADFDAALKLDPKEADAYNNRAIAKKKSGDLKGAISDYSAALRINPKLYRAYYNRGVARFESGNRSGALADFKIASENSIPEAADATRKIQSSQQ